MFFAHKYNTNVCSLSKKIDYSYLECRLMCMCIYIYRLVPFAGDVQYIECTIR